MITGFCNTDILKWDQMKLFQYQIYFAEVFQVVIGERTSRMMQIWILFSDAMNFQIVELENRKFGLLTDLLA